MPAALTPQVDQNHGPNRAQSEYGGHRPIVQAWKQVHDRARKGDGDDRQRGPDRDPIAPGDQKPGEIAVGHAGVGVWTAGPRRHARQLGECQPQANRAGAHDDPGENGEIAKRCDRHRREVEARPDHVAGDDGSTSRNAKAFLAPVRPRIAVTLHGADFKLRHFSTGVDVAQAVSPSDPSPAA
jgi:hypothetical protein